MTPETGFLALGYGWGQQARVAAIARHLPDAVVYVREGGAHPPLDYHGITWVGLRCDRPGCNEVTPQAAARWLMQRNPYTLVMDAAPYGGPFHEARTYVRSRHAQRTFYVYRRSNAAAAVLAAGDFTAVIKAEQGPIDGIDMTPIVAFDATELPSRHEARRQLGPDDQPLVLIVGAPKVPDFRAFVQRLCNERGIAHAVIETYPVMPAMSGADLVVSHAGYSTVHEAAALDVPHQAIASAASPDQKLRADATPTSIADAIAALEVSDLDRPIAYRNHARQAAALIVGHTDWESVDG